MELWSDADSDEEEELDILAPSIEERMHKDTRNVRLGGVGDPYAALQSEPGVNLPADDEATKRMRNEVLKGLGSIEREIVIPEVRESLGLPYLDPDDPRFDMESEALKSNLLENLESDMKEFPQLDPEYQRQVMSSVFAEMEVAMDEEYRRKQAQGEEGGRELQDTEAHKDGKGAKE